VRVRRALSALFAVAIAIAGGSGAFACSESSPSADEDIPLPVRDGGVEETAVRCGDTSADPTNCGACGNVCPAGSRGAPSCASGTCALACETGFGDCNGRGDDGCEADLTNDVASCGACGRDCRACGGTTCTASTCDAKVVVTSPDPDVSYVALDTTRVYYVNSRSVQQVDKNGASPAGVFTVANNTGGIGVDTLVNLVVPGAAAGTGIYRTSAGFVGPQAPYAAAGKSVLAIAVDTSGLYYATETTQSMSEVARCKNCGGNPTVLLPNANAVSVQGIALDESTVFVGSGDTVRRIEKTGADAKTLVVNQTPRSLAVDATHVYWINLVPPPFFGDAGAPQSEVARIAKTDTSGAAQKLATGLRSPAFLAAASSGIYFSDRGRLALKDGTIERLSPDGKARLVLARGLDRPGGVAVDDTCVYFGDATTVKKVTR